jgi:hypothetical protein
MEDPMKQSHFLLAAALFAAGCDDDAENDPADPSPTSTMSFFVTSSKSTTGNLGGLRGADTWFNANGVMVARDLAELHARRGDALLFVDEQNQRIPGQWSGSPRPVEHDILTGSTADGRVMPGLTCNDWNSSSASLAAQVGHSDGLGPNADPSGALSSWNSSHASQSCADTAPRGGAGRIYCFAAS